MKNLIKVCLALAAFFASFCTFICVLERLSSKLSMTPEEEPAVDKIQFNLDV